MMFNKKNRKTLSIKKWFKKKEKEKITFKEQILSMIYFEFIGFCLCLIVLFILSGGKNYIKLYLELNKLINVYDAISTTEYGKIDKKEMINSAIEAMTTSANDAYTNYTNEQDTNNFLENIDGVYEGIGCTVATDSQKGIYVVSIFDNSPAKEAGLKEKDIIIKIDNKDFSEKTSKEMSTYIKNNKNDKIKLTIKRNEEEKELTIVRKKIKIPTVSGKTITMENKKIGYIQIAVFSSVTDEQFKEELEKLEKEKIEGLIIDVRNNTGGYLTTVTNISNLFLEKGQVIYQLESNKKIEKVKDTTKEKRKYPIAIIVNAASASASEILASAIKESYHGFVVGTKTYGKGTVQKTKKLSDGSMIKYTIEKWLTPDGNWINEVGLEPTDFVELKSSTEPETDPTIDKQLEKAKELIYEKIK